MKYQLKEKDAKILSLNKEIAKLSKELKQKEVSEIPLSYEHFKLWEQIGKTSTHLNLDVKTEEIKIDEIT